MRTCYRVHEIDGAEVMTGQEDLDLAHVAEIADSMRDSGWVGAKVVTFRGQLLTGNHRCAAAEEVGIEIESIDLLDLLAAEGIDAGAIAEVIEDYPAPIHDDYSIAEELARLIPGRDHGRLGIDFGCHN